MHVAEVLQGGLSGLSVRVKRCLILLQKLLLYRDIMVGDAKYDEAILRFA